MVIMPVPFFRYCDVSKVNIIKLKTIIVASVLTFQYLYSYSCNNEIFIVIIKYGST